MESGWKDLPPISDVSERNGSHSAALPSCGLVGSQVVHPVSSAHVERHHRTEGYQSRQIASRLFQPSISQDCCLDRHQQRDGTGKRYG